MNKWNVSISNVGNYNEVSEKEARREFADGCDSVAAAHGRASGETVTLWRDGEPVAEFEGNSEPGRFLAYCLARVHMGEFWQRLAGSVRKAGTL